MNDSDLMRRLLREMAADPLGNKDVPLFYGISRNAEAVTERRHVELLVDAGHAEWRPPKQDVARITKAGRDFLTGLERGGQWDSFKERFDRGMEYVKVVSELTESLGKLTQS